jgi:hypothetical protein
MQIAWRGDSSSWMKYAGESEVGRSDLAMNLARLAGVKMLAVANPRFPT